MLKKRYVCIQQHDITDCGAACLASISKYYGLNISITKIREMAGTDTEGTNAYGLIKAAKNLGFEAKGFKCEMKDISQDLKFPAIAHIIDDNTLLHFVIIYNIKKDYIVIGDPAKGIVKYTFDEFEYCWTGGLILLEPGQFFEKGNYSKGMLKSFLYLIKPLKLTMMIIFIASLVYTGLGLLSAFYIKYIFDYVLESENLNNLHMVSFGFCAILLIQIFMSYYRSFLLAKLSIKIDKTLMMDYYSHVLKLPMNFFSSRKTGEIISRFLDASKIREAVSGVTLTIMIDTIMVIAGGILLYNQNAFLFFVAVIIAIFYGIIVVCFNRPIKKINRTIMENNAQLTSTVVESIKGIEAIKAYTAEHKTIKKTKNKMDKYMASTFKGSKIMINLSSLTGIVAGIGGILILWIGAYKIINGEMSSGDLLAFNALLVYFLSPIRSLIDLQPLIQTAIVASNRLGEILELEKEKSYNNDRTTQVDSLDGDIEFKNIDFRYGTRKLAVKNINLFIPKGQKVALVGESGSGKTTLAKLLMNFYTPEKGEVLISAKNIKDISLQVLRRKIAFISQDVFIFSGTVKENICLGIDDIELEKVIEASKRAKAHEFIEELPLGYDNLLQENGVNLSEGQKQRIAIARALITRPDIIIMDEATSNLDTVTENEIKKTLYTISKGITVIVIAHRLSTVVNCNKIHVMKNGEIIESGNHNELINSKGYYHNMWAQYEGHVF
ncbi:peptidase domain-containing ABC transporter [Herbivorax sp. ANBcel31]|uniref:peptidase domain-containing ABC transporter n=1 Tax=Herbivorax sp. ANBcel31 TaxID=3069754 RepID=UPI0027B65D8C|nr:peptidase domain-containing ABC transporter [Herbivorax sp. ANBcel31]MDQ2087806.1 peptidase domain-containing ABC transporter [Herbivorax sp. ANBcel31]